MPQISYAFSQKLHKVSPTTGSQPLGFGMVVVCPMKPRESDAQEQEQAILICCLTQLKCFPTAQSFIPLHLLSEDEFSWVGASNS